MKARTFTIHTDGGARGNPGPGAIGVVIREHGKTLQSFGAFIGERVTNNQAEYRAVEEALKKAKELGGTHLSVHLDSELVANQLRREFKIKDRELSVLFVRVWNLMQGFKKVTFIVVPREKNYAADAEVNRVLDSAGY
ncbi:MAG: ribonuclease HI family protein [Candidatus Kerfeldbacteria bacterium]